VNERGAAIFGATSPLTARPITISPNTSPARSATKPRSPIRNWVPCLRAAVVRARPLRPARRCPPSGAAASTSGHGHSTHRHQYRHQAGTGGPLRSRVARLQSVIPDQIRFEVFERHLKGWIADMERGKDTMPNSSCCASLTITPPEPGLVGQRPSPPSPTTISRLAARSRRSRTRRSGTRRHSSSSKTMPAGADHVDAHRSLGLVISKVLSAWPWWSALCR